MHGTCLAKEVGWGGGGRLEVKEKSMSKKWKCQNAQLTEGIAKFGLGLRARSRSGLRAGDRLWSDHNGPSVPPQ